MIFRAGRWWWWWCDGRRRIFTYIQKKIMNKNKYVIHYYLKKSARQVGKLLNYILSKWSNWNARPCVDNVLFSAMEKARHEVFSYRNREVERKSMRIEKQRDKAYKQRGREMKNGKWEMKLPSVCSKADVSLERRTQKWNCPKVVPETQVVRPVKKQLIISVNS